MNKKILSRSIADVFNKIVQQMVPCVSSGSLAGTVLSSWVYAVKNTSNSGKQPCLGVALASLGSMGLVFLNGEVVHKRICGSNGLSIQVDSHT